MSSLQPYSLLPHISVFNLCRQFFTETAIVDCPRGTGMINKRIKDTTAFVITAIAIYCLSTLSILYNTVCFLIKGSIVILTHVLEKDALFNHSKKDYMQDMNFHIAYAVKDLITYLMNIGISMYNGYNNDIAITVDDMVDDTIHEICTI